MFENFDGLDFFSKIQYCAIAAKKITKSIQTLPYVLIVKLSNINL